MINYVQCYGRVKLYEDKELPWNYDLDTSYFSWNDGDKRLTDKDWIKTGDLVIPIPIILMDIFLLWTNSICSNVFPEAFYINKQLKTINTYKWKISKISHVHPFNGILPSC